MICLIRLGVRGAKGCGKIGTESTREKKKVNFSETTVDYNWNVMAQSDARVGKWRGNWRMEWVASTLHTTSEHGVSSLTTAGVYTGAASSRLNWRPCRFKWTLPFRRKTKSGFCGCAITFQTECNCLSKYSASYVTKSPSWRATNIGKPLPHTDVLAYRNVWFPEAI